MNYLKNFFNNSCEFLLTQYNFKKYKNNYYRVINDVFQSLCLHESVSNSEATVEFAVVPLCTGQQINKSFCGIDHLKMFENDYSWFFFNCKNQDSMEECILSIIEYIKKYLLPFFESANNSKNAYLELIDFQKKHYKNGVSLGDHYLFCMALKAGFYKEALTHLTAKKQQIENAFFTNRKHLGDTLPSEYERKMITKLNKIDQQVKMISRLDYHYIDELIKKNESIALLNLL